MDMDMDMGMGGGQAGRVDLRALPGCFTPFSIRMHTVLTSKYQTDTRNAWAMARDGESETRQHGCGSRSSIQLLRCICSCSSVTLPCDA